LEPLSRSNPQAFCHQLLAFMLIKVSGLLRNSYKYLKGFEKSGKKGYTA